MKSELELPRNIFTEQETLTIMLNFAKITKMIALDAFLQGFFLYGTIFPTSYKLQLSNKYTNYCQQMSIPYSPFV